MLLPEKIMYTRQKAIMPEGVFSKKNSGMMDVHVCSQFFYNAKLMYFGPGAWTC